jgi:hypothetical protein
MIETITIALWAHLFCGPWSESGKVFGWLKSYLTRVDVCSGKQIIPNWITMPLIGCAMCHAVWVSMAFQALHAWHGVVFDFGSALMVTSASFFAWLLDDFAELRDKWKNA